VGASVGEGLGEGDASGVGTLVPEISGGVFTGGVGTGGTGIGAVCGTAGSEVRGGIGMGLVFGASGTGVAFWEGVAAGGELGKPGLGLHAGRDAARKSAKTLFMANESNINNF